MLVEHVVPFVAFLGQMWDDAFAECTAGFDLVGTASNGCGTGRTGWTVFIVRFEKKDVAGRKGEKRNGGFA